MIRYNFVLHYRPEIKKTTVRIVSKAISKKQQQRLVVALQGCLRTFKSPA
jgi:hypothetical protein